jgi:hypothetical protein
VGTSGVGWAVGVVKPREERRKVMVKARMRSGASWHDVCILNISTRGLGIQAADPPQRGAYLEICRGRHMIVARVMWTSGHRAGLKAQDSIFIDALVNEPVEAAGRPGGQGAPQPVERRRAPRPIQQRHDRSRIAGRAFEFVCFAILASAIGITAFGAVEKALAQPLSTIEAALSS